MNPASTAIVVFAQSGRKDALTKGIPGGEKLLDTLTSQTIHKVKRTGFSWFHMGEKEQRGASFGERLSNAIQDVFIKGFENIIVIGNDSPGLTARTLRQAGNTLVSEKAILGPASDGGVYLIGLNRSIFTDACFESLPWKNSRLYLHLLERFQDKLGHAPAVLEHQIDLDSLGDIRTWACQLALSRDKVLQLIRGMLKEPMPWFKQAAGRHQSFYPVTRFNKGSPFPSI
ncbi:MAG: DUF2064 domain-containing protein [Robiginitalea sp.]